MISKTELQFLRVETQNCIPFLKVVKVVINGVLYDIMSVLQCTSNVEGSCSHSPNRYCKLSTFGTLDYKLQQNT